MLNIDCLNLLCFCMKKIIQCAPNKQHICYSVIVNSVLYFGAVCWKWQYQQPGQDLARYIYQESKFDCKDGTGHG